MRYSSRPGLISDALSGEVQHVQEPTEASLPISIYAQGVVSRSRADACKFMHALHPGSWEAAELSTASLHGDGSWH